VSHDTGQDQSGGQSDQIEPDQNRSSQNK
jgi:hypothetical protein